MRLFVAVWPPAEVVGELAAIERPLVPGLRWTTPDQWHVTLRFLGRVDDADVDGAVQAVAAGVAGAPACEAVLGPATARLAGGRVLCVPVAGLDELAARVLAATAGVGEPPEDRPFRGHVTLARSRGKARVDWRGQGRGLVGVPVAGRWRVGAVGLVESHLHPQGARYRTVATVPLAPPPELS